MSDLYFKCFSLTLCSGKPLYCINKCNGNIVLTKKTLPLIFIPPQHRETRSSLSDHNSVAFAIVNGHARRTVRRFHSCDNMCNLDKLLVAKKPLPLPKPYDKIWLKVRKIVDRLQIRNHKNPECCLKYGSDDLKEKLPSLNN